MLPAPPAQVRFRASRSGSPQAYGINDQNQVVGSYSGAVGNLHGFVGMNGVYYTADIPGASGTVATGISNDEVVGYHTVNSMDAYGGFVTALHGFALTENGYATLGRPRRGPRHHADERHQLQWRDRGPIRRHRRGVARLPLRA